MRKKNTKTRTIDDYFPEVDAVDDPDSDDKPLGPDYDPISGVLLPSSIKAKALPWPDDVPVLVAADVCHGNGTGVETNQRRSLLTWFQSTFPSTGGEYTLIRDIAHDQLLSVLTERSGVGASVYSFMWASTPLEIALAWNEMLRRLGYEVEEPKANLKGKQ